MFVPLCCPVGYCDDMVGHGTICALVSLSSSCFCFCSDAFDYLLDTKRFILLLFLYLVVFTCVLFICFGFVLCSMSSVHVDDRLFRSLFSSHFF